MQCSGIEPNLVGRRKSHGFHELRPETGIFSCYDGDGHSKLLFVDQCQDSCLVTRDTSGISSRLGTVTQTLLKVKRETQHPFLVATVILGFLSIFNKSGIAPF